MLRQLFKGHSPAIHSSSVAGPAMAHRILSGNSLPNNSVAADSGCRVNASIASTSFCTATSGDNQPAASGIDPRILLKSNPVQRLQREISKPGYHPSPITLGATEDPYRPSEYSLNTTRQLLELLHEHRHPVHIITNSHLIVKDLDILADMAKDRLCTVEINVNTLDDELKGKMEPRTSSPAVRLKTIARLTAAGVPTGAIVAPVIPLINDGEIEQLLSALKLAGATTASYQFLSLPGEVEEHFNSWLLQHFPERAQRIFNLTRVNHSSSATEFANMVGQRFHQACRKLELNRTGLPVLDTTLFKVPQLK